MNSDQLSWVVAIVDNNLVSFGATSTSFDTVQGNLRLSVLNVAEPEDDPLKGKLKQDGNNS